MIDATQLERPPFRPEIHSRPTPIAVIKKTGREFIIQDVNRQAILGFGGSPEDLIGNNVNTLFEKAKESSPLNSLYWNTLKAARKFEREEQITDLPRATIKTKSGELKTIQFAPKRTIDPKSGEATFDIEITDITKLVEAEQDAKALQASSESLASSHTLDELFDKLEQHIKQLVPHDTANFMMINEEGQIEMSKTWGYGGTAIVPGLNPANHTEDRQTLREMMETNKPLLINDTSQYPGWMSSGTEKSPVLSYIGIPIHIEGKIVGFINLNSFKKNTFSDRHLATLQAFANQTGISIEKSQLFKQLEQLSLTDPLTGLHNRRSFEKNIERELERAIRFNHPISMLMIDLDDFKKYNDSYGHPAGDKRLQEFARILHNNSRNVDTIARYGGEEFTILLPVTDAEGALRDAEKMVQQVRTSFSGKFGATVSIGVATFSKETDGSLPDIFIQRADEALYEAKRRGKNRVFDARNLGNHDSGSK